MQLIHAIVALVAASQATAIASNPNLMARSSIAEATNMKYTRDVEECKALCDASFARRANVDNAKSNCLEKCASDNQDEDGKARKSKDEDDEDKKKDEKEEKDKQEKDKKKEVKCFDQCSPHPGQNLCHESAPCLYIAGQSKYYCGCPAGLKPDNISPENAFRLPWSGQEGRVFVKPGVSCLNRCQDILTCAEVDVQPQCF